LRNVENFSQSQALLVASAAPEAARAADSLDEALHPWYPGSFGSCSSCRVIDVLCLLSRRDKKGQESQIMSNMSNHFRSFHVISCYFLLFLCFLGVVERHIALDIPSSSYLINLWLGILHLQVFELGSWWRNGWIPGIGASAPGAPNTESIDTIRGFLCEVEQRTSLTSHRHTLQ
jgi:hypothetical protein